MGIRLNKTVGYGLHDIKSDDMKLIDDRFDPEGIMFGYCDKTYSLEGYCDYLKREAEKVDSIDAWDYHFEARSVYERIDDGNYFTFESCFVWRSEYGLPNVFLCMPVSQLNRWHRRDDILDYTEENHNGREQYSNYYRSLGYGLYPWSALYCDKRDGRSLKTEYVNAFQAFVEAEVDADPEKLKEILGFDSMEEAKKNIRPIVPKCVKNVLKYCKVFKNESSILDLETMSYTYWS